MYDCYVMLVMSRLIVLVNSATSNFLHNQAKRRYRKSGPEVSYDALRLICI